MARPTKLTDELTAKAAEYLDRYEELEEPVPSVAGLACFLKVARSSIYLWSKGEGPFSDIVDDIHSKQEQKLLTGGLLGNYNPSIAKLMLTKHGYSDKQQQEVSGPDGTPVQVESETTISFIPVGNDKG